MDWTTWVNTIVSIIGIVVGIVGIVVGIIGWKSLSTATKIKTTAKADNNSTIQQAQIINNGIDSYAVIRLSRETTQEELQKLIDRLKLITREEMDDIVSQKMEPAEQKIDALQEKVQKIPRIHISKDKPTELRDGDIWGIPE